MPDWPLATWGGGFDVVDVVGCAPDPLHDASALESRIKPATPATNRPIVRPVPRVTFSSEASRHAIP